MSEEVFKAGDAVRLVSDPGRTGSITGRSRPQAGVIKFQVAFPDGNSYHPDYELELVSDDTSDPFELIELGKYGRQGDLRRNLTHVQLSGRIANIVYSMDTTNTDFYAYQFKPVLSFLESPSKGLLIADEVGLGKTIEAGLIWTELRARYDSRRLVVVCPAMLQEKWRDELRLRFAVDAKIVNAEELLHELKQDRRLTRDGQGLICSMQGIRPPRNFRDTELKQQGGSAQLARFLDEHTDSEPLIDLVIIDEAHNMRNPESQTAKLGKLLRDVSEHIVLLTATPINLRSQDLYHLLNLVDPDTFDNEQIFPQVLNANAPLNSARTKALDPRCGSSEIMEELLAAQQHSMLSGSLQLKDLVERPTTAKELEKKSERIRLANRIERINLLQHAVSRTRKVEVTELKVVRDPSSYFVPLLEGSEEYEFYWAVTEAIREYAKDADVSDGFLLATPQRQVSSCMYAAAAAWQDKAGDYQELLDEDTGSSSPDSDRGNLDKKLSPLIAHMVNTVLPGVNIKRLRETDSKFSALEGFLADYLDENPGEQVVVFSFFRGTIHYLAERLGEIGVKSQVLLGGMQESKQDIIDRFRTDKTTRVLLSTEVASEGVDLQFCRVLVNYDLPWNPMKVEQRIGRIDRIGQKADVIKIINLYHEGTIDERIHSRLLDRLGIFEKALGGLEAVLGEEIRFLTSDLLSHRLTPEQEAERIEKTAIAMEKIRHDEQELENNASHLIAHGGYILEQVHATRDFKRRITDVDLLSYVKDYLETYAVGSQILQLDSEYLDFEIKLPPKTAAALFEYVQENKLYGRTRLPEGDSIHCRFINKVQPVGEKREFVNQFHPLVRFIGHDLRDMQAAFYPLVAIRARASELQNVSPGRYVFAVQRWSFNGLRADEELRAQVYSSAEEKLLDADESWMLVAQIKFLGADWFSAGNEISPEQVIKEIDSCEVALDKTYEEEKRQRINENLDRVRFQVGSAERHRDRHLHTYKEVLSRYRETGKTKMIPALKGRIEKIEQRFEVQVERLKQKEGLTSNQFQVCYGVLVVQGD